MKHLISTFNLIGIFACTFNAFAETAYKSKSIFDADYKCVSEEKGGFSHSSSGHQLLRFRGSYEFFLTHISNIPEEGMLSFGKEFKYNSSDINELRRKFEADMMKQETIWGNITEQNSYFLRKSDQDPKSFLAYLGSGCEIWKGEGYSSRIRCDGSHSKFILNLNTMKFTYSYLGSWHEEVRDGYYGDSSVFAFGTCKKYYR